MLAGSEGASHAIACCPCRQTAGLPGIILIKRNTRSHGALIALLLRWLYYIRENVFFSPLFALAHHSRAMTQGLVLWLPLVKFFLFFISMLSLLLCVMVCAAEFIQITLSKFSKLLHISQSHTSYITATFFPLYLWYIHTVYRKSNSKTESAIKQQRQEQPSNE